MRARTLKTGRGARAAWAAVLGAALLSMLVASGTVEEPLRAET
jgi:hypothetical protein